MNTRRDKNIRKALTEIDLRIGRMVILLKNPYILVNREGFITQLEKLKILSHRIKRTTWRGEKVTAQQVANAFAKDKGFVKAAKRINTNTTTKTNFDASMIPHF